ncbi:iron ABC transporter permease [Exilibacterium tricleocarpae]|uniref:Iron ABC transporter permease n=1 Tax=Exilibacterium tricleocarpae TaxID=2591008 RepID=A0A545TAM5_9GAMM|nr:ABC transporter permease subunit [Exilibacterium tricleocarpae]TQV74265.1 iron ABC transporter permease [Exilibacterium tricleocarpae]
MTGRAMVLRPAPAAWGRYLGALPTVAILLPLVVLPVTWLIARGIGVGTEYDWLEVVAGPLSVNLFWRPFANSVLVAVGAALLATLLGGLLALLFERTDIAGAKWLRPFIALPFLAPSFALAMAWVALFDNNRIGGSTGLLSAAGVTADDGLAWGVAPIVLVLGLHYFPLAYFLVAAALARLSAAMVESAALAGAGQWAILRTLIIPSLRPAFAASALICFAEAISNFSVPAILGTPVRFFTLSTQLYRLLESGQAFRGSLLLLLLTVFSLLCLTFVYRRWGGYQAPFAERIKRPALGFRLGRWRWPVTIAAGACVLLVALVPVLALLLSSLAHDGNPLSGDWTLHYWIGAADPLIAQGQKGVLRLAVVYEGLGVTLAFGLGAALIAALLALYMARWCRNNGPGLLPSLVNTTCLLPAMLPSIGLGAAFLALYGGPIGPLPALYGSFALLIMVGVAATLPYAMQSAYSALAYIPTSMEEAARVCGASSRQRLQTIVLPLSLRAVSAGVVVNFSRLIRNLDLVILIFTPMMPLLAVLAYRFSVDGFPQFARALALIILALAVLARLAALRMQRVYEERGL